MGIYNVKNMIREARLKAGLTQEKMAEGICTAKTLSKVENKIVHEHSLPPKSLNAYLDKMENLAGKKDVLYLQEYLFLKTTEQKPPGTRITDLIKTLLLTLSEFQIDLLCSYRLIWCELMILNIKFFHMFSVVYPKWFLQKSTAFLSKFRKYRIIKLSN